MYDVIKKYTIDGYKVLVGLQKDTFWMSVLVSPIASPAEKCVKTLVEYEDLHVGILRDGTPVYVRVNDASCIEAQRMSALGKTEWDKDTFAPVGDSLAEDEEPSEEAIRQMVARCLELMAEVALKYKNRKYNASVAQLA